jgi:hypothetical protein
VRGTQAGMDICYRRGSYSLNEVEWSCEAVVWFWVLF